MSNTSDKDTAALVREAKTFALEVTDDLTDPIWLSNGALYSGPPGPCWERERLALFIQVPGLIGRLASEVSRLSSEVERLKREREHFAKFGDAFEANAIELQHQRDHWKKRAEAGDRCAAELKRVQDFIVRNPHIGPRDAACRECAPHSDVLVIGFLCVYHAALSAHQSAKGGDAAGEKGI